MSSAEPLGEADLAAIEQNRKNFKPLPFHEHLIVVDDPNSKSLVYKFGIKLIAETEGRVDVSKKAIWYCLFPACVKSKKYLSLSHTSSSNIAQHLKLHRVISERSKRLAKTTITENYAKSAMKKMSNDDLQRHFSLSLARFAATGAVSLRQICTDNFISTFKYVNGFPKMYEKKLKDDLLDLYVYIQNKIRRQLKLAAETYKVPFLHLSADIYTSSLLRVKFLGIRVSYMDIETKAVKSFNLAIRKFKPSMALRMQNNHVSDILMSFTERILSSFELSKKNILTATSDAGSDIKRLTKKCLQKPTEWCLAHIFNCCLVDAFGVSQHLKSCKNIEAREVTAALRRVLEHVNKSDNAMTWIKEKQEELDGKYERLANFIHQRWSSAFYVYEKFLRNFDILQKYFNEVNTKFTWPSILKKRLIQELFSILNVCMKVIKKVQGSGFCVDAIATFQAVYLDLKPGGSLKIFNSDCVVTEMRIFEELEPVTQSVLITLQDAFNKRFFDRYHPVKALKKPETDQNASVNPNDFKFSYIFDLCQFLVPELRHGFVQDTLIEAVDPKVQNSRSRMHLIRIRNVAFRNLIEAVLNYEDIDQSIFKNKVCDVGTPLKKRKVQDDNDPYKALLGKRRKHKKSASSEAHTSQELNIEISLEQILTNEITEYLRDNKSLDVIKPNKAVSFWVNAIEGKEYPVLARMALAFFGAMPSSAGLERDFSPASDIITNKRANLNPWLAEVLMVVKLNDDLLPDDLARIESFQPVHDTVRRNLSKTAEEDIMLGKVDMFFTDEQDDVDGQARTHSDSEESYEEFLFTLDDVENVMEEVEEVSPQKRQGSKKRTQASSSSNTKNDFKTSRRATRSRTKKNEQDDIHGQAGKHSDSEEFHEEGLFTLDEVEKILEETEGVLPQKSQRSKKKTQASPSRGAKTDFNTPRRTTRSRTKKNLS